MARASWAGRVHGGEERKETGPIGLRKEGREGNRLGRKEKEKKKEKKERERFWNNSKWNNLNLNF